MRKTRLFLAAAILLAASAAEAQTSVGSKTQALDQAAWATSEWIAVVDAPVVTGRADQVRLAADGANWFVSTLKNEKEVNSAKWMTTGLGVYELYLNGQPVGTEVLKPGFTHYAKTKLSFTYDVTDAFVKKAGKENTLAVQVTPGWWADRIVTPGDHEGMIGRKCAFRGVLELTFADGSKQYYGTDREHWKAGIAGSVKHAAIFDGETYDARELPGYAVKEKLSAPEKSTEFEGEIVPSEGAEIYLRRDLTLKPVCTYVWQGVTGDKSAGKKEDVEYGKIDIKRTYKADEPITLKAGETLVVDFGQNCAAVPSFTFAAKEGTTLTCLPGEMLNDGNGAERRGMDGPEGSVHRRNLRMQDVGMRLVYTFGKSKGAVSYYPHCTFFGYRYISVTATDEVRISAVESIPVSSISCAMETGTLTTGHVLINQLISNTQWGQRSNYLSVPTDCPQRDERLGWMADTQVFAETGTFFANTDRFFHKWMRDVRDTQSETGAFPGVAPQAQYGAEPTSMMRLGWADAGIIVPWTVWKQFGDKAIIEENWAAMDRFMQHVNETKYDQPTVAKENDNYQWADWLSYEPLETCLNKAFDENWQRKPDAITYWSYLGASYWLIDAEMMRDMAKATGRDAAPYQQMAEAARAYIRETFLNGDGTFKTTILNTMQTPALFALKNGIVEGDAKEQVKARLKQNFADHGNCLQTGFLGTSILMQTLTDNGMTDVAYELLFQRKNPSWIYSIDNGATTIWERWNSYMKDRGLGPVGMNSFNHYAYGCVCQWLWETAAGIAADPEVPGFKHIIMKPKPDRRLGHLTAEYQSAAGLIKSAWRYDGDEWTWDFTIPEGATAAVTLPGETVSKDYGSGSHHVVCKASPYEPVDYVSTLVGTESKYELSTGNTYPAVALPWGMNFWVPQTGKMGDGWQYTYSADKIRGFKQTHQPSPWINDYGQFSIFPTVGERVFDEQKRASWFSHKVETATPYYYKVYLADYDVTAEIAPTERAALLQFTFPETSQANIVVDAFDKGSYVKVIPGENKVVGYTTRNSGGVPDNFRNWFVVVFDKPFLEAVTVQDSVFSTASEMQANHAGAVLTFKTCRGEQVTARAASSFISLEQAELNLKELAQDDLEQVKANGRKCWNDVLGRIEIEDSNIDHLRTFYSCLYRSVLFPRSFYEINAEGEAVHYSPYNGEVKKGYMFTDTGFWDTFRCLFPLLNLVYPSMNVKMQEGLVNTYLESGFLPEWASPGHRTCMVGNNSASIVADAYLKGLRGYDIETLWKAVVHGTQAVHPEVSTAGRAGYEYYNRLGYVPCDVKVNESAARTLEYAYDDWCIWQLGKALGKPKKEIDIFAQRAMNYKNLFDPSHLLMRGKKQDGEFQSPFNPLKWGDAFTEGNSWHYTWSVFHDPQGLIGLMGGKQAFNQMLDSVFALPPVFDDSYYGFPIHEIREMQIMNMGNYAHGNQPIQHMIYLYGYSGQPWKTQYWIRQVMDRLYSPNPDGYCGDEDNGQTSAWYVFSALGFYPVCPGSNQYVLGTPYFRKAAIHLENGQQVGIERQGDGCYIRKMTLDGTDYQHNYLGHDALTKGARICFEMDNTPNILRGTAPEDAPYSFTNQK